MKTPYEYSQNTITCVIILLLIGVFITMKAISLAPKHCYQVCFSVIPPPSSPEQIITPEGKTKRIPKRGCAFCVAFGGRVVKLAGGVLEGRRGGRKRPAQPLAVGADDKAGFLLSTAAL